MADDPAPYEVSVDRLGGEPIEEQPADEVTLLGGRLIVRHDSRMIFAGTDWSWFEVRRVETDAALAPPPAARTKRAGATRRSVRTRGRG